MVFGELINYIVCACAVCCVFHFVDFIWFILFVLKVWNKTKGPQWTKETALYRRQHFTGRIDVEKDVEKNKTENKKKKAVRLTHEESNKEKSDDTETPTANKNQIYSYILFCIHTMQALMQRVQLKAKVKCVRLPHTFLWTKEKKTNRYGQRWMNHTRKWG